MATSATARFRLKELGVRIVQNSLIGILHLRRRQTGQRACRGLRQRPTREPRQRKKAGAHRLDSQRRFRDIRQDEELPPDTADACGLRRTRPGVLSFSSACICNGRQRRDSAPALSRNGLSSDEPIFPPIVWRVHRNRRVHAGARGGLPEAVDRPPPASVSVV